MKRPLPMVDVLFLGLVLSTAWGCSAPNRAPVKGKVTVDSVPLPEGSIDFVADKGAAPTAGARIIKGEYAIVTEKGLLPGEYQVQIRAVRPTGKKIWDGMGDELAPASKKNMVDELESYVPARYNDQTELRAKIELGKVNVCDYDLTVGKK
jgi:hypothetical protein